MTPRRTADERTRAILSEIARGRTTRQIAARLGYRPSTVKSYVHAICITLECQTRAGAVYRAIEIGLLKPGGSHND